MPGFLPEPAHVNRTIQTAEGSNWEHCLQHDWIAFKDDWWGAPGQARLKSKDGIFRVTQNVVIHFDVLTRTNGQIYVRMCDRTSSCCLLA
ncbi:hypothetical protein OH76DRAFT_1402996 [Lentinus brumalis]|uniref:Uncharacterized protein n=1 Tax=Lentinus brumalis TaxID=2498619 RepID=A0A371DC55_9APHY|nr:hypothetical protein OH76DRAFT_1402996 [Polyporus brumalis]